MSAARRMWMGYRSAGGRASLDDGGPGSRVSILGARANEAAALSAI